MRFSAIAICAALLGVGAGLSACEQSISKTETDTPRIDGVRLDREVAAIADRARPAVLGVALMNLESGEFWTFNGDRTFPLASALGAPLAAATLSEVDAGRLKLDETLTIDDETLSPPPSPIADAWPARRAYSVRDLLTAVLDGSDTTADDVLMKRIGGPGAVTGWLRLKNVEQVRVDRYAREIGPDLAGMASFRAAWKGEAAYAAAMATATPRSLLHFLMELDDHSLLSRASSDLLLQMMTEGRAGGRRLRAGLPPGVALAHQTGSSRTDLGLTPATNDLGILTLPDKRRYAVVVFLSGSTLDAAGRDAVIADVARAIVRGVR
jgi:beta-lactamase class A